MGQRRKATRDEQLFFDRFGRHDFVEIPRVARKQPAIVCIAKRQQSVRLFSCNCKQHIQCVTNRWYVQKAIKTWTSSNAAGTKQLAQLMRVFADGKQLDLGSLECFILLNLPSYSGGADLWNGTDNAIDDGVLEIVGFTGSAHLAIVRGKVGSATKLCQAKHVRIEWLTPYPLDCQVNRDVVCCVKLTLFIGRRRTLVARAVRYRRVIVQSRAGVASCRRRHVALRRRRVGACDGCRHGESEKGRRGSFDRC